MPAIVRGVAVYLFLLIVFRIAGKRTLAEVTTFDLVLTLIISESIQQGLIDTDNSLTNAFLTVVALVGTDILLSSLKQRWPWLDRVLEGMPVLVVNRGKLLRESMLRERVDEPDILHAARAQANISTLAEIDYAVVERSGGITIVSKS